MFFSLAGLPDLKKNSFQNMVSSGTQLKELFVEQVLGIPSVLSSHHELSTKTEYDTKT